jgi:hypothetical protein
MARKRQQAGGYVYFAAQPPTRRQIRALPSVNQQEIDVAYATIAAGDPSGLSAVAFDRSDVELIGRYLETRSIGGQHLVWQTLLHGERWAYWYGVARSGTNCGVHTFGCGLHEPDSTSAVLP